MYNKDEVIAMIEIYVNNITRSLKDKCYFSALALALALPDMCGMAEFPSETSVAKRYIEWYDRYLGSYFKQGSDGLGEENPWLSGEVVYNLRNTYLHQGNPNVIGSKIKEQANQIDRFILMLGDGTVIHQATTYVDFNNGEIVFRNILVDITYLCENLCDCALWYYQNNKEKFEFQFSIITQDEFLNPTELVENVDVVAKVINKKLIESGSSKRVIENPNHNMADSLKEGLDIIFSNEDTKQRFLSGKSTFTFTKPQNMVEIPDTTMPDNKKNQMSKREAQIRSFFGRHFKKKIYIDKKEEIIQSVLEAETKQQVNNNLMQFFRSEEVKIIYQRLQPLLKNMPGK